MLYLVPMYRSWSFLSISTKIKLSCEVTMTSYMSKRLTLETWQNLFLTIWFLCTSDLHRVRSKDFLEWKGKHKTKKSFKRIKQDKHKNKTKNKTKQNKPSTTTTTTWTAAQQQKQNCTTPSPVYPFMNDNLPLPPTFDHHDQRKGWENMYRGRSRKSTSFKSGEKTTTTTTTNLRGLHQLPG